MRCTPLIVTLVGTLMLAACKQDQTMPSITPDDHATPVVCCVNYPLFYFTSTMAGDAADVRFPVPAGVDPAFWQPDAADVRLFQQADLILLNGAGYARWTRIAALPESRMIDTTAAVRDRLIEIEAGSTHSHGLGGEHSHAGIAFTTWLDLDIAIAQADAVRTALVSLLPDRREDIDRAYAQLRSDLRTVHDRLVAAGNDGVALVGSHPVYQYFQRAYQLDMRELNLEPDELPDATAWREIERELADCNANWILWEAQPLPELVARLGASGMMSVVVDPCANRPEQGDFLSVMRANADVIERIFSSPDRAG